MSVYVDNMQAQVGRMKMCHMAADTSEELLAMADTIRVHRKWIQYPGTWKEHFDICMSRREMAVTAGALSVTTRELFKVQAAKRDRR